MEIQGNQENQNKNIEFKDILLWQSLLFSNKNYRSKPLGDLEACNEYFSFRSSDQKHIEQTK